MLFNSYLFLFLFLPITLFVFFKIGGLSHHRVAIAWLVGASLFFYGWWNPAYLALLVGSAVFNYTLGVALTNNFNEKSARKKTLLIFGIGFNLGLLGYFKYANFFIDNINKLIGSNIFLDRVILPLAISFFTFQQITYLVDAFRGETREYNFLHYFIFVTFFPQLIAGPIVHHREMLPQFAKDSIYRFNHKDFAIGITIFTIGLIKKVVLADGIAPYTPPVFDRAAAGITISFFEAWVGSTAYGLQLYFDFSGYSDMAIGLARLIGIRLPLNFNSPYKATNIIDFWRRWHITLSRFLRDYLYFPLGGNRKGQGRTLINLFVTMLLGGLWHGANWTFVIWGSLHGVYLIINHVWHNFKQALALEVNTWWSRGFARVLTFIAVVFAWVFFRAENLDSALAIAQGMVGGNGFYLPITWFYKFGALGPLLEDYGIQFIYTGRALHRHAIVDVVILLAIAWILPNTQQFMAGYKPAIEIYSKEIKPVRWLVFQWKPNLIWASISALFCFYIVLSLGKYSEFLYFQF